MGCRNPGAKASGQKVIKQKKKTTFHSLVGVKCADTRFSEFLTGVLSKGVWWMP